MIVVRVRGSDGVEQWNARLTNWRLRRENGTIDLVGSERYGAMGRNRSLYTETRVSERFYTERILSLSPSTVRVGRGNVAGRLTGRCYKFLKQ